ncbi:MAG: hypothetical protein D3917_14285, partial [Candidatus Electrothrix sp. AX5]|nr:hypothetical protein [Candidatus Electrothrix sp. AX5]
VVDQATNKPVVPDINGKEEHFCRCSRDTQQGGIIGIINDELTEDKGLVGQLLLQSIADVEEGEAGVGIAAVNAYEMKHGVYYVLPIWF